VAVIVLTGGCESDRAVFRAVANPVNAAWRCFERTAGIEWQPTFYQRY